MTLCQLYGKSLATNLYARNFSEHQLMSQIQRPPKKREHCIAVPQILLLLINIHCIMLCILPSTWKPITVEKSTTFILQSATTGMPASMNLEFKFANLCQQYPNVQRMQINQREDCFAFYYWTWKLNVICRFMQQRWQQSQNSNIEYLLKCE